MTTTLTKADEYRRELSGELSTAMRALHSATREFEEIKEQAKEAKASVEVCQNRVNRIAEELRDVELGQYQPKLMNGHAPKKPKSQKPEPAKPTVPVADDATKTPIEALEQCGLTAKECEKLRESELEITTIGKLEQVMREDEWWMKKVRGIGPTKIDRVTDALLKFRQQHPVPDPDDVGQVTPAESPQAPEIVKAPEPVGNNTQYPDRNAPGGEDCGSVNRWSKTGDGYSVQVCVGFVHDPETTFRSSVFASIGDEVGGRDTPRQDSEPHATQEEAARAAIDELIEAWSQPTADSVRQSASVELRVWRDETWPVTVPSGETVEIDIPEAKQVEG